MAQTCHRFVGAFAQAAVLAALGATLEFALEHGLGMPLLQSARAQGFSNDPLTGMPPGISSNGNTLPGGGAMQSIPLYGPSGPARPDSPSRPGSWPGGPGDTGARRPRTQPAIQQHFPAPKSRVIQASAAEPAPQKKLGDPPYDPAEIIAYVGTEVIQANEILPSVNQQLAAFTKHAGAAFQQLSESERKDQLNAGMRMLMKQYTAELIKTKLLVSEIHRKIPAEAVTKTETQARNYFNANELSTMRAKYNATSNTDLDNKLRELGSSLDAQRTVFIERFFAIGWLNQQVKDEKKEVTHEQMLEYYKTHLADWESPARVRWEQLTALYKNYDSKGAARGALARWGNEIFYGAPFAAVAKAHSQEPAAVDGGTHDWISKGSLRSEVLDQALFSPVLPVGALSQIIEDDDGMHIIRVLAREDLKVTPFTEVQGDIKKALQDTDKDRQRNDYIEKLREQTRVLTIFDDDFAQRVADPNPGAAAAAAGQPAAAGAGAVGAPGGAASEGAAPAATAPLPAAAPMP